MAEMIQYRGTGRRKTSVARVRLIPGGKGIEINGISMADYFGGRELLSKIVEQPLALTETLDKFGAVSEETAIEMAKGIANYLNSNVGLSTTGIAGPGGGTNEKPVGLVYIGLYINGEVRVKKLNLSGSRENIRKRATSEALNLLRLELQK